MKRISHSQQHDGKIIILENVPAEVCRQCGEVLLRPDTLERVQKLVLTAATPKRTARIPVYAFAEAA
ncbi:MAG: YgiT-type zinc finger protein [Dehalococcoidia bacterium]|nr:YgiT-type zinc finger protein [Dehalococcoidia bacterium]MSQ16254.1 YgiT-type zinc finger protein [Dehalococcoidia bacterium]